MSYSKAPKPSNETRRLQALHAYHVLDTEPERAFDELTQLAAHICQAPIAMISLVDSERQWFKAKIGVTASETSRDIAFCAHGILQTEPLIVTDALQDARFAGNPLVTTDPKIRFYAGAPLITPEGLAVGMLCVNDRVPRQLRPDQVEALQILARQVVSLLELRKSWGEVKLAWAEHQRVEESLRQRTNMLQLQQVVAAAANEASSVEEIMQTALDLVCAYTGWAVGHAYLVSETDPPRLVPLPLWHVSDPDRYAAFRAATAATFFLRGQGLPGKVWARAEPVWNTLEPDTSCPRAAAARRAGLAGGVGFPILAGREVAAVLEFFSEHPIEASARLVEAVQYVSAQVGRTLERARAAATLQRREEYFRSMIEQGTDIIAILDERATICYASPSVERVLGYPPSALVGSNAVALLHPEDVSRITALLTAGFHNPQQSYSAEFRAHHADGSWRVLEATGKAAAETSGTLRAIINCRDVTERRRAEAELRTSEEKYRLLFDSMLNGFALHEVLYDAEGRAVDYRFLEVNPAFETLTGLKASEVVGRTVREVLPASESYWIEQYATVAQTGEPEHFESHSAPLGKHFEVVAFRPRPGQFAVVFSDITERKRAEEGLRQRLEFEKLIATISTNFINVAGAEVDREIDKALRALGEFSDVDRSYVFEFSSDGRTVSNTYEWCRQGIESHRHRLQNLPIESLPWIFGKLRAGEVVHVPAVADLPLEAAAERQEFAREQIQSLVCVPMAYGGSVMGFVGFDSVRQPKEWPSDMLSLIRISGEIVVNALQRKRTEQALHETNRRLEEALEELQRTQQQIIQQERLRALGQMASGIAHDFNNALAPILGFSELLLHRSETRADPARLKHFLQVIHTAARDATGIVGRLREFYRNREENEVLLPVNLNQLIEQAVHLTQPKWREQSLARGIQIRVETRPGNIPSLAGNETDLREMLTNLIFNAVDAMPEGGTLTLATRAEDNHVVLTVQDTGIGMSEEVRRRCLEPFFTTKGPQGTGLGLSMVHGIVRRHEGTIEIQSEPGRGTTFLIRLPLRLRGRPDILTARPRLLRPRPSRILLVEDEPMVREIETEYLKAEGHTVVAVAGGAEAIEKFRQGTFDVVLLDRAMPGMSGDQVAAALKRCHPKVPVILLTGFGDMMQVTGERPTAVDLILSKPVSLEQLRQAVNRVVKP